MGDSSYNEVWASENESEDNRKFLFAVFTQTPVVFKAFIQAGTYLLMNRSGESRQPGYKDYTKNSIIEKGEIK